MTAWGSLLTTTMVGPTLGALQFAAQVPANVGPPPPPRSPSHMPAPAPPPPLSVPNLESRFQQLMEDFAQEQSVHSRALADMRTLAGRASTGRATAADHVQFRRTIEIFIEHRRRVDEIINDMRRISLDPEIRRRNDERARVEYRIEVMLRAVRTTERLYSEVLETALLYELAR